MVPAQMESNPERTNISSRSVLMALASTEHNIGCTSAKNSVREVSNVSELSFQDVDNMIRGTGEKLSKRIDDFEKANETQYSTLRKDFEGIHDSVQNTNQRIKALDKSRIETRSQHHELKRRFECLQQKFNSEYLK